MEGMGYLEKAVAGLIRDNGGMKILQMNTCRVLVSDGEDFRYTAIIPDLGEITLVCETQGGEIVFKLENGEFLSGFEIYFIGNKSSPGLEDRILRDIKRRQAWASEGRRGRRRNESH